LAKAFWELDLDIPAVIRLGGNTEDRAGGHFASNIRAAARASGGVIVKPTHPRSSLARFAELVAGVDNKKWKPRTPRAPKFVKDPPATKLAVKNGRVWIDTRALAGDPRRRLKRIQAD
jgi:hypothetical protein